MNLISQTTSAVLESSDATALQVQALLDKAAISDLAALYCVLRDDHEIDALLECFSPDGTFISGGRRITGHDALREWYLGNMRRYAFSHHIPHSHVIAIESDGKASGIVTGHVEFASSDALLVGAYRWYDEYEKVDGRWVFTLRHHKYMYCAPVDQLMTLGADTKRVRMLQAEPRDAELLAPGV
jgi:hypothetical protein